jgi:plastocyanin
MRVPIALVFAVIVPLVAAGCGSSSTAPSSPSPGAGNGGGTPVSIVRGALDLTTTAYAPNPVTVAVGTSVTWTNNDTTAHTSTANDGTWNSGTIAPGSSFTRTFASAGTFTYHCTIHPNMVASVTVQ